MALHRFKGRMSYSPFAGASPAQGPYVPFGGPSTPVNTTSVTATPASCVSAAVESSPAGIFVSAEEVRQLRFSMLQLQERVDKDEREKQSLYTREQVRCSSVGSQWLLPPALTLCTHVHAGSARQVEQPRKPGFDAREGARSAESPTWSSFTERTWRLRARHRGREEGERVGTDGARAAAFRR